MNAKKFFGLFVMLLAALLSACSSAAPMEVVKTVVVNQTSQGKPQIPAAAATQPMSYAPTMAPAATTVSEANKAPVQIGGQPGSLPPAVPPLPMLTATPAPFGVIPTPVDNFFEQYGVNPFVDTREDHLSTFSLDVDTASYTVARSYIQQGNLPPADAIRVEEFVNYFNPGYPIPADVAFALYADGAPSPFQNDGTYLLRLGVQGYQVPEYARKPLNLTFVIDVSGSMADGNRLGLVQDSIRLLVDRLTPIDIVSVVAYTTDARIVLNPTSGSDHNSILNAVYSLQPEASTNAEAGLRLGYQLAMQSYRGDATNRVILLSDGVANVGATGPDQILAEVHGYVDEGITLTTIGVGMGNFNDVLLEQLADKGDGNYAYIDNIEEARKVFVEDLVSTMQVIGYDAKVQVDFNSDVVARYRLIGYENRAVADSDFRNDTVDAGEIGAGHSATAIYAVQLRPGAQGRLSTVQLRWQDAQTREIREINGNFNTWDLSPNFDASSPRYQLAVIAAQYAELLRHSPWSASISMYQLSGFASRLVYALPEDSDVAELANLIGRASQIGSWDR